MLDKIKSLQDELTTLVANGSEEVEQLRIKYLSKKGLVSQLFNDFKEAPAEQKREVGKLLNELKDMATATINELKEKFGNEAIASVDNDLTKPATPFELGSRHPLSIVRNEIVEIFGRLGFNVAEGPEIEDDWHVFTALNFPLEHPARDMQDTFFIEKDPDSSLRGRIAAHDDYRA